MRKITYLFSIAVMLLSCTVANNTSAENGGNISTDNTYGYTEKNPVKVGGTEKGPLDERKYLSSLTGPNGEQVSFVRVGSCCPFSTRNSPFGGGLLDMYTVTYEGKKDSVTLYLNMYDKAKVKAPVGFKMK